MPGSLQGIQAPQVPGSLTSLVGRERETAALIGLLRRENVRLVTLTGPGGVGKTRLALRVAKLTADDFPGGTWFVPLASIRDPALLASTVAQSLGVRETADRSLIEGLATVLGDPAALLILDNCEHLLDAAPVVAEMLLACPRVTCLVTSRSVLRISGEHAFPVPTLPLTPAAEHTSADRAALSPAVRLFMTRAQAARPEFALTDANAAEVERVCRRLDGLPLALELAAARMRHLELAELAALLASDEPGPTLRVLTGGPRDAPDRQRALRHTVAWSYGLLSPAEQRLMGRFAGFVGSFSREAGEAVARAGSDPDTDVHEGIASLLDQSLLQRDAGDGSESRFKMLETIREFALEQLAIEAEDSYTRQTHAAYYLTLAERAAPELHAHRQREWIGRLTREHGNLRAALDWFDRVGDLAQLARLAWALFWFWWFQGHLAEAAAWYERIIATGGDLSPTPRGSALIGASQLAWTLGDFNRAEALALEARTLADASVHPLHAGLANLMLNSVATMRGDASAAQAFGDEALRRLRTVETWEGAVWLRIALNDVGLHAAHAGDAAHGIGLLEEAIALAEGTGDRYLTGVHWSDLGLAAQVAGHEARAVACYREGVLHLAEVGGEWYLATPLAGLAAASAPRDPVAAAQLLGAAEALRDRGGQPNWPIERDRDAHATAVLRAILGPARLDDERARGRRLPLDSIRARVTGAQSSATSDMGAAETNFGNLSPRELDVLRLLVASRTDREIAETLFISPRTASRHVGAILAKLDVASRGEAAVYAVRHRLV
jgi:predicted ATPase/DNA-binding CsgD family transcriptional regulator